MPRSKRGPTVSQQRLAELRAATRAERLRVAVEAPLQEAHAAARARLREEEERERERDEVEAQLQDLHVAARRREEEERVCQQEGSWDYREAQAQNDLQREEHQRTAQEEQIRYIILTGRDGKIAAPRMRRDYESPPPFFLLNDDMCEGAVGLRSYAHDPWPGERIFGFSHNKGEEYHYLEINIPQSKSLLSAEDSPRIKRVLEL